MPDRLEAIISGRVQGVRYRDFVQKRADEFGILGEVQNLNDGTVLVVAEGLREQLDTLLEYLHKGPMLARVTKVYVTWAKPMGEFTTFKIVYPNNQ